MPISLTANVQGYNVEVRTIYVGVQLSTYTVSIASENANSPEQYASIRIYPDECNEAAIQTALEESYPTFPADKRTAVFSKIVELMLQLKPQQ